MPLRLLLQLHKAWNLQLKNRNDIRYEYQTSQNAETMKP